MRKILTCLVHLTLIYIIPLFWNIELILRPEILILILTAAILILTQPVINVRESKDYSDSDKLSFLAIIIAGTIGQIASVLEWSILRQASAIDPTLFISAGILIILGLIIRILAISTLGRNFAGVVQIKQNQELVTSGLYSVIRHPSYTGAWLIMLGAAFLLQSISGFVILGLVMIIIYQYRIRVEEETLISGFGESYVSYKKNTWKMFPLIW
ncbi:MAG: protein-S-isoprenylcysteine O-methyltransferase Ste14 [Ulvibacter sp.]|jgi:protein-S-isoprenylcysteine O-methyltransferase Ste14